LPPSAAPPSTPRRRPRSGLGGLAVRARARRPRHLLFCSHGLRPCS